VAEHALRRALRHAASAGRFRYFFEAQFEVSVARHNRPLWIALVGVPLLFTAIAALQVRIDAEMRSAAQQKEELLLRSGKAVKELSLGYDSLLADIYWTRAVQYYGERVGTPGANFDLLWPLLDIATTLDPKLIVAYRFGAIFLSEPGMGGAGRTDLAIELVKRGIAANPDQWHLGTDLGFLYYWRLGDYADSSAAYLETSKNPKAPTWVRLMAARIAQKGGSIETSRMIWSEIYDSTKDESVRKMAAKQLEGLKAEEDEAQLDELAEQFRKRLGRYPGATREMRDAGMLGGIPTDPEGYPYVFGQDGKSRLNSQSPVVIPAPPRTPPELAK
jgi:tetratricopeptide (TPR) repeat protein